MITSMRQYSTELYIAILMNVYNNESLHKRLHGMQNYLKNTLQETWNVHTLVSFTYLVAYIASMGFLLWKSLHYVTVGEVWQGLAVGAVAALFVTLIRAEWHTWKSVGKALRWRD